MFRIAGVAISFGCLLASTVPSNAGCYDTAFQIEKDNKQKNIKQILDFGRCVKAEEHERVGKWFCYVDKMVGIQIDDQKRVNSGDIKPSTEKFFVTIKEISDDNKQLACDFGEYGIQSNLKFATGNSCLANFEVELSPSMGTFYPSPSSFHFGSDYSHFNLYGTKNFVLFRSYEGNSYVSEGTCEKLN
jgi:hypothetical protein